MSLIGAACFLAGPHTGEAWAQADAGREPASAPIHDLEAAPKAATPAQASPFFPKAIRPSMLAESVQSRLEERDAERRRESEEEPRRRGEARMKRVRSVETEQGITILSNRLTELPAPRLAMTAPMPAAPPPREGETVVERPEVTETLALRAITSASVARDADPTWLGWVLASFMAVGAVVGTLWFRKKTQT